MYALTSSSICNIARQVICAFLFGHVTFGHVLIWTCPYLWDMSLSGHVTNMSRLDDKSYLDMSRTSHLGMPLFGHVTRHQFRAGTETPRDPHILRMFIFVRRDLDRVYPAITRRYIYTPVHTYIYTYIYQVPNLPRRRTNQTSRPSCHPQVHYHSCSAH
jgi:hypothetical protein